METGSSKGMYKNLHQPYVIWMTLHTHKLKNKQTGLGPGVIESTLPEETSENHVPTAQDFEKHMDHSFPTTNLPFE